MPHTPVLRLLSYRPPDSPTALGAFRPVCKGLSLTEKTEDHTAGLGAKPTCQARRKKPAHLGMVGVQTSRHTQKTPTTP